MNTRETKKLNAVIVIISLVLIACNVSRMVNVSITHDEALSYRLFITRSYLDIIDNYYPVANNHFLNSILAKFSINIFGDSLFSLRIPNLLAHIVYLLFSFLLAKTLFKNNLWVLSCFLLLQLNPFLFDFWGLCRGYGLSLAFMLGSIYYLKKYLEHYKTGMFIMSCVLLAAAVYANFSLLNYAMGFLAVLSLHLFIKPNLAAIIKAAIVLCITAVVLYWLLAPPVTVLIEKGELYYGGDTGFIHDTVATLLRESLYLAETNKAVYPASVMIVVLVFLSGLYWGVKFLKSGEENITGFSLWLLLVIPAISTITQHYVLGNKYLIDRTALFFYPLLMMMLVYTLYSIVKNRPYLKKIIIVPVVVLLLINFVLHLNFHSTRSWESDQYTPMLMERMVEKKKGEGEIKIYPDWLFTPSLRYYAEREYAGKFGYIEGLMETAYEKTEYDFYLIRQWEVHKVPDIYVVDTILSGSKYYLYQRKQWD